MENKMKTRILIIVLTMLGIINIYGQAQLVQSFEEMNNVGGSSKFGVSVSGAGDVNNDGYPDVIVGAYLYNSNTGRAYIYYGGSSMDNNADVTMTGWGNSYFGYSVSGAGDVNNDGYADVIVGAYKYYSGFGVALIYYGGSSMDAAADVTMWGEGTNNYFGYSVSDAGDVNNDGYADVIVGAYAYNTSTGRAYIYYGGSSMDAVADVTLNGAGTWVYFSYSVSGAGDVNNDGYSDVIVGEYGTYSNRGRAYIYYGGSSMDAAADVSMDGYTYNDRFGLSVSGAGDVNNDGYADVIVGSEGYSSNTGRAYIYFGGSSMDATADVYLLNVGTGSYFGNSVAAAGDLNNDGFADVIVGAKYYGSYNGRAYIYNGGSSMDNVADVIIAGNYSDYLGISVSGAGDINNDSYADVIVGAYGYSGNTGGAHIYYGGSSMDATADVTMTGEGANNYFGYSVSGAGDVNNDGYADVIVGAWDYYGTTGRAYIYYGGSSMDAVADVTMNSEVSNSYFGYSVSGAGDVNNDGYADVIVGAYRYNSQTGRTYIYYGGSSMDTTADVTMTGEGTSNQFGISVSGAGDVNNDGYADVIVGAREYNSYAGRVYIYYGGSSMDATADVTMTGFISGLVLGASVSGAGDVNNDGYADVIVGAYGNSSITGRAYIYFGGSPMDANADKNIYGQNSEVFGYSVSGAGDVNNDGYADVVVGAYGYSSSTGRAYIYYGGSSMDAAADVTMTGEGTYNYFGYSVSGAGDVNNDGYADVIVGAHRYNSYTGRTYIYYGGSSMDATADVTMTGEGTNNYFGYSVSGAGDVNNDGYDDVIIGAYKYPNNGKAYIYSDPSATMTPNNPQNALNFDGVNDYVDATATATGLPQGNAPRTMEAWIKTTSTAAFINILSWGRTATKMRSSMGLRTNHLAFVSAFYDLDGSIIINDGSWHHVAVSFDGTTMSLYVDGVLDVSSNMSLLNTTDQNLLIGTIALPYTGEYWDGDIDEVRIWSVARTQTEIQNNMNNGNLSPSTTGLVALYHFDQGTGGGNNSSETTLIDATANNIDGTLINFALTGSGSNWVGSSSPLPVELVSFSANVFESSVKLNWQTATEINNYGFEIERKMDEQDWANIGFVNGHGNSNSPKQYSFTDNTVTTGRYSYRLKQIDTDGSFEYSDVVEVTAGSIPSDYALQQNYPNPFNPSTTIKYQIPENGVVTLKVYDVLGKEVATLVNSERQAGSYTENFNALNLSSGIYLYTIKVNNYVAVKKMMLLK